MFTPSDLQKSILLRLDELKGANLPNADLLFDLAAPDIAMAELQYLYSRGLVEVDYHAPSENAELARIGRWGLATGIRITRQGYEIVDNP